MIRTINIVAWVLSIVFVSIISIRMGTIDDSRTTIIHIDGQQALASSDQPNNLEDGLLDTADRIGSPPQTGSDNDSSGTSETTPAVIYNDSGAVALSEGRAQEAVRLLKQALSLDPTYARAMYNLGIAYQSVNRPEDAIQAYNTAFKLRPNYFEPCYNLGCLYSELGNDDKAITWLTKATDIVRGERSAPAHLNLGNIYRKLNEPKKAEASYREALRVRPSMVEPRFNLGLLLKSEERYREAVDEFNKVEALDYRPAKLYRNLGICYSNLDSLKEAEKAYAEWAEKDSTEGGAWYNLAITRARLDDTTGAIDAYERSLQIDSSHYQAAFNLALLYSKDDEVNKARKYYEQAISANPSYSRAYYNLALTFSKEGAYDSAIYYYQHVVDLDPENSKARFNLGLAHMKNNQPEVAAEVYHTIIDLDPANGRAINSLGDIYLDLHEYDSALYYFNRLVNLSGEPESYFNRAKAYHRLDSLEKAKEDYRTAIKLKPTYGAAYHNLAILEEKSGNLNEAEALLEKAVAIGNQGWKRYWKLGQVYVELGKIEKAREAYAAAAQEKPNSTKFWQEYETVRNGN